MTCTSCGDAAIKGEKLCENCWVHEQGQYGAATPYKGNITREVWLRRVLEKKEREL